MGHSWDTAETQRLSSVWWLLLNIALFNSENAFVFLHANMKTTNEYKEESKETQNLQYLPSDQHKGYFQCVDSNLSTKQAKCKQISLWTSWRKMELNFTREE